MNYRRHHTEASKNVATADAVRILKDGGKKPSDLATAVDLIRARRGWAQQASKLRDAESALAALDREQEAAHKTLVAAEEEFKAYRASFIARQSVLLSQHADCMRAIDDLQRASSDPQIMAAERELAVESHGLAMREKGLRSTLDDRRKHATSLQIKLNNAKRTAANWLRVPGFTAPAENAKAMAEEFSEFNRTAVLPLENQLATINQQRAALSREQAQLAEAKLVP